MPIAAQLHGLGQGTVFPVTWLPTLDRGKEACPSGREDSEGDGRGLSCRAGPGMLPLPLVGRRKGAPRWVFHGARSSRRGLPPLQLRDRACGASPGEEWWSPLPGSALSPACSHAAHPGVPGSQEREKGFPEVCEVGPGPAPPLRLSTRALQGCWGGEAGCRKGGRSQEQADVTRRSGGSQLRPVPGEVFPLAGSPQAGGLGA